MIHWDYNANDYKANNSNLLEEGKYRVRVINAMETVAKNGTQGISILLEVNGHSSRLRHYIWYNRDYEARTNQLLGEFFNSFDIPQGEQKVCDHWIGKRGAVYVMHDVYKGRQIAKVAFCLPRDQQGSLPAWNDTRPVRECVDAGTQPPNETFAHRQFGDIRF